MAIKLMISLTKMATLSIEISSLNHGGKVNTNSSTSSVYNEYIRRTSSVS